MNKVLSLDKNDNNIFKTARNKKLDKTLRNKLLENGFDKCYWCKCWLDQHTATLEHITPLSEGGTYDYANLALACHTCNTLRHNKGFRIVNNIDTLPKTNAAGKTCFEKSDFANDYNKVSKIFFKKNKDLSCRNCKCFLDKDTACLDFIAKYDFFARFKVGVYCFDCLYVSKNIKNKTGLPTRNNKGKLICW